MRDEINEKLADLRCEIMSIEELSYCMSQLRALKSTLQPPAEPKPYRVTKRSIPIQYISYGQLQSKRMSGMDILRMLSTNRDLHDVKVKLPGSSEADSYVFLSVDALDKILPIHFNDLQTLHFLQMVSRRCVQPKTIVEYISILEDRMPISTHLNLSRSFAGIGPTIFDDGTIFVTGGACYNLSAQALLAYMDLVIKKIIPAACDEMLLRKDPRRAHYAISDIFSLVSSDNPEWVEARIKYNHFYADNFLK